MDMPGGADFGSMLPDSLTPNLNAASAMAIGNPTQLASQSESGKHNPNKRGRVQEAPRANVTPAAATYNPLKHRKLNGTTPGLSLSISARKDASASPLSRQAPMSPWVSQVKQLPVPNRASSVHFSSNTDVNVAHKSRDKLGAKRRFSYEIKRKSDKKGNLEDKSSSSSVSSKVPTSAAASPSSTPLWSTAASRAHENNVFLKHGSQRFKHSASVIMNGRTAHRALLSSSLSQNNGSRRRSLQSRDRSALHSAVASRDITAVRGILNKIA
jgi:hypothetical protein